MEHIHHLPNRFDLKAFYNSAWERQPESKTFQYKIDSAIAKQKVASSFLASPASIEFSQKTDKANNNLGASETVIGLGFPLWLWNERSSSVNLANAEYKKLMSQYYLSQLKVAATTSTDRLTKFHLNDLVARIENAMEPK